MKKHFVLLIVLFTLIASCSKKGAPTGEKAVDVAALFSKNCARCHGADGMSGKSPNLAKTDLDKKELIDIITNGHEHMPHFNDKLSSVEISAISKWILTLKKG